MILTLEENELVVRASKGDGFRISTSVRDRIIREKTSLMIRDAQSDQALSKQESIVVHRVRSMMAAPLQAGDTVIGLIYVDTDFMLHPFTAEDLDLLTVMANVAAIRIENARLTEIEQSEKMVELELTQASEIQRSLLPNEAPVPTVTIWRVCTFLAAPLEAITTTSCLIRMAAWPWWLATSRAKVSPPRC